MNRLLYIHNFEYNSLVIMDVSIPDYVDIRWLGLLRAAAHMQ